MKRIIFRIAVLIVLALALLSFAGCQKKDDIRTEEPNTVSEVPKAEAEKPADKQTSAKPVIEEPKEPTLKEIAASMQDYSHKDGEDAAPIETVDDNVLLLVNKTHPLGSHYKADDLVTVSRYDSQVGSAETHQMRKLAADALEELMDGAEAEGYNIVLRTGYRSYDYQSTLYSNYVANHGEAEANKFSAKPGESEHQTGWCCDVGIPGVYLTSFTGTEEAEWIAAHAHEYGFILRYPKEKEDITGYIYESWHIRYVGEECAKEIYENNLTLEEYLGVVD